ncbi:DUF2764 family protein [Paucihalobacter ruber]|uniref:DUF2764 family protein n=1 Tax=Paucihalobacter ruber TaxID=2567861 RepID=A0A506PNW8_9FLAO|nr:DUF2764 family protein [Paucihalobacter ruber]TPV35391.1 DUF2764 family protein [Paucihalobacter ruber]
MKYYYLISSLPDISPHSDASKLDFDDLFDTIRRNLNKEDRRFMRYLIYPNDLNNLLSMLSHEYRDTQTVHFKKPSIFYPEEIKAYKLTRRNFPDFMNDFLSENEDRLATMSLREMEDAMLDRFYSKVFSLNNHFLTNYYKFVRELTSLTAAFHFNTYSFLSQPNIHDADRLILQVGPDRSPSAMVIKDYPYLEELIKVLSKHQPEKTERFIDSVIWNYLDDTTEGAFSREAVYAYAVKLQLLQRWLKIDPKPNNEDFEKLLDKIINNNPTEKTPTL